MSWRRGRRRGGWTVSDEAGGLGWLAAAVTAGMTLWKMLAERKKISAEGGDVITHAALALVEPLERRITAQEEQISQQAEQIATQREEIAMLRCQMQVVMAGVNLLVEQIQGAGLDPIWTPPGPEKKPR